ncbi:hypothetical protein N7532_010988 [Penicillium argentinense]|uniref:Uncharacterized protein n=1 Tax=Penicillium argentinense TaxID=1131581 RepID=A0A9W9EQN6_9EURO|nr:uncharacterized protein N7532_010988 [Penicillium argentinense]KAJ5086217.1 hypothetical protein N7532_010988 [Penicillium argentinense]
MFRYARINATGSWLSPPPTYCQVLRSCGSSANVSIEGLVKGEDHPSAVERTAAAAEEIPGGAVGQSTRPIGAGLFPNVDVGVVREIASIDGDVPVPGEQLRHPFPRVGLGQRLEVFALDEDGQVLELLEPLAFDRLLNRRPDEGQSLGWKEIEQQLLAGSGIHSLRACLEPPRRRIQTAVVEAGWIMLDQGALVVLVDGWKETLVHPNPKVLIPQTARLLLLPEESWEQEVDGDIFESDQSTKRVVWDHMHGSANMVHAPIASRIVDQERIKMEAGTKISDGHLCWVPTDSQFGHREATRKADNTVNIEGDSGWTLRLVVCGEADMDRMSVRCR